MTRTLRWSGLLGLALSVILAGALVGCVGTDDDPSEGGSDATPDPDRTVQVTLGTPHEFAIGLSPETISAGSVNFEVTNGGSLPHQFVIVPHEGDPSSLPIAQVNVDTDQVQVLADSGPLDPAATFSATVDLEPGGYVIFSNIGGHYSAGMFVAFTAE
ncbi:MAG: hypothetical protein DWG80_01785 [Chloroflexi bacterium]|nr:hypothetical protein [Chloroflexota bacterium]